MRKDLILKSARECKKKGKGGFKKKKKLTKTHTPNMLPQEVMQDYLSVVEPHCVCFKAWVFVKGMLQTQTTISVQMLAVH